MSVMIKQTHPGKWHNQTHVLKGLRLRERLAIKSVTLKLFMNVREGSLDSSQISKWTHTAWSAKHMCICIFHCERTPSSNCHLSVVLEKRGWRWWGISCAVILRWWKRSRRGKTDKTEDVYHSVMGNRAVFGIFRNVQFELTNVNRQFRGQPILWSSYRR